MKKVVLSIIITAVIAAGFTGCKKILEKLFPGLDVDVPVITVIIPYVAVPPGTPVFSGEISFPPYTQHFNLDSSVRAKTNGAFNASDVSSIKLKQIIFTIQNPDSLNNLSNFKNVRFTFQSNTNTNPLAVASFDFADIYAVSNTYTAPSSTPELRPYLDGTELTYNVYGTLRRYTTKNLQISVNITVRAK